MLVPLEAANAADIVKTALETLQTNVVTIMPIALGISVLVFGAKYIWGKARSLVR